jgi:hypothetical protein
LFAKIYLSSSSRWPSSSPLHPQVRFRPHTLRPRLPDLASLSPDYSRRSFLTSLSSRSLLLCCSCVRVLPNSPGTSR